jgi:hypothetical protein
LFSLAKHAAGPAGGALKLYKATVVGDEVFVSL